MFDWVKLSKVKASPHRIKIICFLSDGTPKTPSEIRDFTGIAISHISQKLHELVCWGLIECLTPERHRGKLFRITKTGMILLKYLNCN